ncbi:hypothetical protein OC834_000506 [Tilletia horrida]|uniref:Zinc finger CHCC-type domain-containing protein n=1 Tax=Tilletia horrida TaxID=155126 RepID=A0AAN6GEU4_9BASI|nr:hypothetical protein OC835_003003 [Tilletia horrida]KAK0537678.1 hypothetical protein OC842_001554 [Tilletia horrida]KAK0538262.1 hypothetical protein OC834_000506 [Tilletia horrida]KAK0566047.1 hypothetical protein OC844_000931 [Tilletia horrida]
MTTAAAAASLAARSTAGVAAASSSLFARRSSAASTSALARFSTSAAAASAGDFQRPPSSPSSSNIPTVRDPKVAQVHTPPHVPSAQSPNYPSTWTEHQNPREHAMRGPRFEQIEVDFQPQPLSAMAMIQKEPVRLSSKRIVSCDGGGGPLGHPKIFINLDKPGPKACTYCGVRFELDHGAHH